MRTAEDVHDELLVMGCQDGDGESLIALVNRWQPRLLCHAMRLTRRARSRNGRCAGCLGGDCARDTSP